MLVLEPVQAAIRHCLNHHDLEDATFLAERLYAEVCNEESLQLLATCYYRSGRLNEAYHVLRKENLISPEIKFLLAKCCFDLNKLAEAEAVLRGGSLSKCKDDDFVSRIVHEFGESASFALKLLARVYDKSEQSSRAAECERKALRLNPFLWKVFESSCNRGKFLDPAKIFSLAHLDNMFHCHGVNAILNVVNNTMTTGPSGNCNAVKQNQSENFNPMQSMFSSTPIFSLNANVTPANACTETPMDHSQAHPCNDLTPFSNMTPSNVSNTGSHVLSGVETLNFSESGLATNQRKNQMLGPPPLRRKLRIQQTPSVSPCPPPSSANPSNPSAVPQASLGEVRSDTFGTPTFGMLPRSSMVKGDQCPVALKLDFSSSSLSILSPVPLRSFESPIQCNDASKQKRTVMSSKENPMKLKLFGQSSNNSNTTNSATNNQNQTAVITPSPASNPIVRRSSRLFGSTQSVKENSSKAPTKKSHRVQNNNSPPRKSRTRLALSTNQPSELAEKNEKNRVQRDAGSNKMTIGEKEAVSTDDLKKPLINVNLGAQALFIQKQSAEGLMKLMRQLGAAYVEMSKYNCKRALQVLDSLPSHQAKTGWVVGLRGKAYFELAEYKEAKKLFKEMRELDPSRLEFMEYYSTALWHLQDDYELSALAQDLTSLDKHSAESWCVTGNCFSHLKEHDNAIKFFKRASQIDPSFAYAFTLLGHEYVMIEELEQALQCFRSAVRIDPRHYNAWYGIGLTYYKQERFALAETYFRKALTVNPQNPILMCHLAVVQHAMQKTAKALETIGQALKISPQNSLCKFEKASILFAAERHDEALIELNELKDLVPKESPVYFLLGKVHNKLNNTHLALMHFSWAMDLDPKGANSQIKDALDPALNRAAHEDSITLAEQHEDTEV